MIVGSAKLALEVLVESGCKPKNIMFLNLICAPEGLEALRNNYPEVKTVIHSSDRTLQYSNLSSIKRLLHYFFILGTCRYWCNRRMSE